MALGGIDLNLLVILQALLEEGNVTRAGARVGMPQPAVSNALARLRRHYKDELLLRAGNGYELTPFARTLLPSVQESTRLIGRAFSLGHQHQPPAGGRVFTICLSDYATTVLGQPLLRRVHELAPDASIQMRLATTEIADGDRGLLGYDLLIAPSGLRADGESEVVLRDRLVYVADPANPRLRDGRLSVADLAVLPHAVGWHPVARTAVAVGAGIADGPAEAAARTSADAPARGDAGLTAALGRAGITPQVAITTAGWLLLPFLVAGTDLVAMVPKRLARQVAASAGVVLVDPPFGPVQYTESAWWHPMHAADPALGWLRAVLHDAVSGAAA
jgi:DNA-binding transcriptional LysR family regulator